MVNTCIGDVLDTCYAKCQADPSDSWHFRTSLGLEHPCFDGILQNDVGTINAGVESPIPWLLLWVRHISIADLRPHRVLRLFGPWRGSTVQGYSS